jgi:hypothetical protein
MSGCSREQACSGRSMRLGITCIIVVSWSQKKTERLIEAVKANEVLYNMTLDGYKNSKVTNKKWDEIDSVLGMTGK